MFEQTSPATKSKLPPAEETTGVQVDGARLTVCEGARCHANRLAHRALGARFWQALSRIGFKQTQRKSAPAAAKGSPLGCLTNVPRGVGFVDKLFRLILKREKEFETSRSQAWLVINSLPCFSD